jgi:hypothetical protein
MQKRIAATLFLLVAAACRHETAAPAASQTTSAAPSGLTGSTRAQAATNAPLDNTPGVGTDAPTIGALVNVPALAGRSRKKVEGVLGPPASQGSSIYNVGGNAVTVHYDGDGRAVWFEMDVPGSVLGAADALRLLSIDALTVAPSVDSEARAEYTVPFSGVDIGLGRKVTTLHATATKPVSSTEWKHIGAGLTDMTPNYVEPPAVSTDATTFGATE